MTRFKICGLRDVGAALVAAESGAGFLGFNFVEGVRRQLQPAEGSQIIYDFRMAFDGDEMPQIVGLFANQDAEFVNNVIHQCGLDLAQLCGDEPPGFWPELAAPVIRQVKVREDMTREDAVAVATAQVEEALDAGHLALLDKHKPGALGGTGMTFDWNIAREVSRDRPTMIAGGLNPQNVANAIWTARPWGVDVSSGVETDGVKDADKIRAFADAVRSGRVGRRCRNRSP